MKDHNSKIWSILDCMGRLIIASILWGFCCLPFFTIGASCTALYYSVVKVIRRECGSSIWFEFFHCFKKNFSQSVIINMIFLFLTSAVSLLAISHLHSLTVDKNPDTVLYICFGLLLLYGWMPIFAYPCLSRLEFSVKQIFMWVLYIGVKNTLNVLILLVLLLVIVFFSAAKPVFLILTPGLFSYFSSFLIEPLLRSCSCADSIGNYSKWYDKSEESKSTEAEDDWKEP